MHNHTFFVFFMQFIFEPFLKKENQKFLMFICLVSEWNPYPKP
jgi:hypothetical protein